MNKKRRRLVIAGVLVLLIPASLFIFDDNRLVVAEYEVADTKIPASFDGFKFVQVSDFHNHAIDYSNGSIIDSIKAEAPDIILITGDFIDELTRDLTKIQAFFSGLDDYLILYENGNHDIRSPQYDELPALFHEYGVIDVSGSRYDLDNGEDRLSFIGVAQEEVDDEWGMLTVNLDPVLASHITPLLHDEDDYRIMLSHHPNFYTEAAALGMDLMLSGHYHGGHIRLFGTSPAAMIDEKFAGGHFTIDEMEMIVSRGTGSGIFPVRINCPSEIIAITLKTAV
jgi:hypothetical protein